MNALRDHLIKRIRADGPLRVADYMAVALGHPEHGYYITRDPLGAAGDFTTAPEISQMYGELIGLWCGVVWQQMGQPKEINLIELGPGRGTLMADALRAASGIPGFVEALQVYLVETSPALQARQREQLADSGLIPNWVAHFADVPEGSAIVIASEFFDALPIRQVVRMADGWAERCVDYDEGQGRFQFVVGALDRAINVVIPAHLQAAHPGDLFEFSPIAVGLMNAIASNLSRHGGAALVVDYGHARSQIGETFQAVQDHKYADVLASPGEVDLTTHVDFDCLSRAAVEAGCLASDVATQGAFLSNLGIESRAEMLRARSTAGQIADVDAALRRLVDADEMGQLFKVLVVRGPDQPSSPGFEDFHR